MGGRRASRPRSAGASLHRFAADRLREGVTPYGYARLYQPRFWALLVPQALGRVHGGDARCAGPLGSRGGGFGVMPAVLARWGQGAGAWGGAGLGGLWVPEHSDTQAGYGSVWET